MKKADPTRGTICRLLTLLLIVLVSVVSAANSVNGASLGVNPLQNVKIDLFKQFFNSNISKTMEGTSAGESTQIRRHLLYNQCSERFVKIIRKGRRGINARGKYKSKVMDFSRLIFESTPSGTIKIFGQHTGLHICYNRKGRLIARKHGNTKRCEFRERYSEDGHYTHYTSAADGRHMLGFKKNGRPLASTSVIVSKREECFKFQKYSYSVTVETPKCKTGTGPEGVDFCDNSILDIFKQKRRLRHSRRHRRRRKG